MHKIINITVIFMILWCWVGQGLAYSSDISYLRVPMGIDKDRADEILERDSGSEGMTTVNQKIVEYHGVEKIVRKKIKKILLVNAALSSKEVDSRPPLGIWYLEAYLKKILENEVEIKIVDMALQKDDFNIEKYIASELFDLVGVSTTCSFFAPIAYETTKKIKKALPDAVIVEGGVHPSVATDEVTQKTSADFVIKGEGEVALAEAIASIAHGDGNLSKIKGIWYKDAMDHTFNGGLSSQVNLDDLPIIPSQEVDITGYDLSSPYFNGERAWPLITERGCPMGCLFCSVEEMVGEKWRAMSPERVVKEIKEVVKRFGITNFYFNDDSFTLNQNRARRIAELLLSDKDLPPIKWKINARADNLTEELVYLMAKAGLIHISFGIESADPVVLEAINKRMDKEQYSIARTWARKYGIRVRYLLMLGLPFQDSVSVNRTIDFIRETRPEEIFVQIYVPFPGSEFSMYPDKYGFTVPETADYSRYLSRELGIYKPTATISTKWMSESGLIEARRRIIEEHAKVIAGFPERPVVNHIHAHPSRPPDSSPADGGGIAHRQAMTSL